MYTCMCNNHNYKREDYQFGGYMEGVGVEKRRCGNYIIAIFIYEILKVLNLKLAKI